MVHFVTRAWQWALLEVVIDSPHRGKLIRILLEYFLMIWIDFTLYWGTWGKVYQTSKSAFTLSRYQSLPCKVKVLSSNLGFDRFWPIMPQQVDVDKLSRPASMNFWRIFQTLFVQVSLIFANQRRHLTMRREPSNSVGCNSFITISKVNNNR